MQFDIERINNKRIVLGWTKQRLAQLAGFNPATVSRILNGCYIAKPGTYKKLAETVGLTMEDICIEEPEVMQSR